MVGSDENTESPQEQEEVYSEVKAQEKIENEHLKNLKNSRNEKPKFKRKKKSPDKRSNKTCKKSGGIKVLIYVYVNIQYKMLWQKII